MSEKEEKNYKLETETRPRLMKLSSLIAAGALAYTGTASEAVAATFEQEEAHNGPIVGKFAGNIYN